MDDRVPRPRFTVIDALIIIVILALIAAGLYKVFSVKKETVSPNADIEYVVTLDAIRLPTVHNLNVGEAVRDTKTNAALGKIVHKESSPYTQAVPTLAGKIVQAEVPGKYSLTLTIRARAVVTPNNITVGGRELRIGGQVSLRTNIVFSTGFVSAITVKAKTGG